MTTKQFIDGLNYHFPTARCELNFSSDFELLIAVVLSAQCTDKRVNQVTQNLFKQYNTPNDFAKLSQAELEGLIYSCGFYSNKAKNIIKLSKIIVDKYDGIVPQDYNDLLSLPGVGRKTANVVSANLFNANVIAVDTHVLRVSNRLGFVKTKNPFICEKFLTKRFSNNLGDLHHKMVLFGRYICKSRNPDCKNCFFNKQCQYLKSLI